MGYEFSGFVDYSSNFPATPILWLIVGIVIGLGTFISIFPQLFIIVKNRSTFGINPYFVFVNSFAQFMNPTLNIICLRTTDFIGIIQVGFVKAFPRMLTFINGFLLWFIYFPVVCYCLVFFDQEPRPVRDAEKIKRERKLSILFVGLCFLCNFLLVCLFIGFIFNYGLGSKQVEYTGKTLGTVSFVFALITWIPQIVTTIRLRDPGSFSIILLLLQAPGGTLSSLFMMIGQGDDWSTWLGSLTAAIQMYVLLGFCIYFKYKKRKAQKAAEFSKDPLINQNSSTFSEME